MSDLPELDPTTGFHPTLNRMGGMSPNLDQFSQAFVEFAEIAPGPVLDVGAAYGVATLAALERGAEVIACDLEQGHLDILRRRTPEQHATRLSTVRGAFPDAVNWQPNSLGGVLLARMLHFLDGQTIDRGLGLIYHSLRPGGKVFGVAVTPFLAKLGPFRQQVYEPLKAQKDPWPGWVARVADHDPEGAASLPESMNFIDSETIEAALTRAGFSVDQVSYFSRPDFRGPMACDGREAVGFVATKRRS